MSRISRGSLVQGAPSLGDLLTARPSGLVEPETWAILCQAVQALQDLFLSDGASGESCIPLVTPSTLMLSSRGRVRLSQDRGLSGSGTPVHLAGYLAPEYRPNRCKNDTEMEKMWIYGLGETLKRATLTSHAATSRLSSELCRVLADMTKIQANSRASLMYLLDIISDYCKRRHQNRPFSHIVMDLHQEALAAMEAAMDTPWGPPAMPELRPRTRNRSSSSNDGFGTIPRRWMDLTRSQDNHIPKVTKEASTSMEDLSFSGLSMAPGNVVRPKSMCIPDTRYFTNSNSYCNENIANGYVKNDGRVFNSEAKIIQDNIGEYSTQKLNEIGNRVTSASGQFLANSNCGFQHDIEKDGSGVRTNGMIVSKLEGHKRRLKVRRNPVQRAASRLYRAGIDAPTEGPGCSRDCVGPEFVVRAALPNKQLVMPDTKGSKKTVTVIMLDGQKLDISCNPNNTTAGQLFELIIQKDHIEENFMLGLSALIAGDFVFLPSDTRISKAIQPGSNVGVNLTLFMRVRFFLPSLRGIRGAQARHLLYLQLRRSILEHQLPCSFSQIIELNGLALQAEFGNFNEKEHGSRDYFLLEHYVPETMACATEDERCLRQELIEAHLSKRGLEPEKAEQDFIIFAQTLPHYGGHFYTATWMLKDNNNKDVWLYISAQGINLYERGKSTTNFGPHLYEMFEWKNIQTLCYSKHYLCILPHSGLYRSSKMKKYKLKMDHKKSYFTFRLASLHHQFFLRLRTEYTSLQSLSQQFGIPLKDMKNETNSLYKLEALTNAAFNHNDGTVNAETEFKIEFRASSKSSFRTNEYCRRSKSVQNITDEVNEDFQNKENENPYLRSRSGLILDSSCLSGITTTTEKRRGVKMGTRVFGAIGHRVSRSMEAVNGAENEYLEGASLESVSLHCSSTSISKSPECMPTNEDVYVIDSTLKSCSQQHFLPNFQESLSESLLDKLNNISFAEERILYTVVVERINGSLGLQITEGSDGNVYIQSVIFGGPAQSSGNIISGDQVIAVDGHSLLGMKYSDALELLKSSGQKVEFIVSRVATRKGKRTQIKNRTDLTNISESCSFNPDFSISTRLQNPNPINYVNVSLRGSPVEKHLTESCHDISNIQKHKSEVPYHKHIRYELELERGNGLYKKYASPQNNYDSISKNISKSCNNLHLGEDSRAVIVDMIPKGNVNISNFQSLDRRQYKNLNSTVVKDITHSVPQVRPLPRSLGLSRKWRGPVRYPVTPVKKSSDETFEFVSTSDDEQVFI